MFQALRFWSEEKTMIVGSAMIQDNNVRFEPTLVIALCKEKNYPLEKALQELPYLALGYFREKRQLLK